MSILLDNLNIDAVKGFLSRTEGNALYHYALSSSHLGPILEVGSYCGKSTIYLAAACQAQDNLVYAVDHHRGSEEHQQGEMFHDPDLFDLAQQQLDSFGEFRHNLARAGLTNWVVPIVASSTQSARFWQTPLGMVFIDGGHSLDAAVNDYRCWAGHIQRGGILAIHDLFANPDEGGQAPIAIYRLALASGLFEEVEKVDSLGILRRC
ncbi:Methyltransferase domain [Spongiibacter sp. IMCC21906]|uniref:class I SAM-dependent methyltransferase n=1 Tax=Spongiibacter sp. IMCC21906 TaxID=1620392 RepID=UPI00062DE35A|nr:class I SAM-dependent methyltransferase [Spongiibacter sp. IMCC21906]AKH67919.1 Methyltransferase domain [Spongiibacter sp. IMCC21906]